MSRCRILFLSVLALVCAAPSIAFAQTGAAPPPTRKERVAALQNRAWTVTATRAREPLKVDGRLDEPDWDRAQVIADFYQRDRYEGLPATERTEVRVLFDDEQMYVGFRCFDREPGKVKARSIFRDDSGGADDLVAVMVDAYHGHRSAIQFVSNAGGLAEDLYQIGETDATRNHNFDTVWVSRGRKTPQGFEVEIAIPFKSLRFETPPPGETASFGIGFKRNIPRKNEEVYWPFVGNDSTWYRPAELGHLEGLTDIRSGRSLELYPYALAGTSRDFAPARSTGRREAGVDLKWGVTTGLTADFTVNTDFAQEEADVQQINFTRFSLFFPEKRQLFLEGEQMFQFGIPKEVDLVFTRRIGLASSGTAIPILAGGRLSGRQGRTSVGVMSIQTDGFGGAAGENFGVVRLRRDLFKRSSVGLLITNRQGGGRVNRLFGADAHFYFNRVWFLEGFVAAIDQTDRVEGRMAAQGRFAYDTDRLGFEYQFVDVGEGFDPGIGYVRRPDSRQNQALFRFSPRPESDLVRQFHVKGTLNYVTDQQNVLETREQQVDVSADFETGDQVGLRVTRGLEAIPQPFTLRNGVVIPSGSYGDTRLDARVDTFRRRHTKLNLAYGTGGYWGGNRDVVTAKLDWRPSPLFQLSGTYERNWIDLVGSTFTTDLVSARAQVSLSNDVAFQSLFQYNRDSRQLSTNVRFHWIPKPGSDVYVVYNELDLTHGPLAPKNRSLTVKLDYLIAF